ncbi:COG2364 Predicted membrane protein [Candidatus Nanopelagicaceae bacterium]
MSNPFLEFLRPHKTVPQTPWTAKSRWDLSPLRIGVLFFGLFIFGLGDSLLIQSDIGNAPWSVLAQGISNRLDITMGWATFGISSVVLLLWIPLREKPGFGTLSNIALIAAAIQVGVSIFPTPDSYIFGVIYCLIGIGMVGIGSSLYITCGLGPGPRDGLMTALHHRSGIRIGRVRLAIEGSVLVLGWLLGGTVGLGTLLFATLIGQSIAVGLGVVSRVTSR